MDNRTYMGPGLARALMNDGMRTTTTTTATTTTKRLRTMAYEYVHFFFYIHTYTFPFSFSGPLALIINVPLAGRGVPATAIPGNHMRACVCAYYLVLYLQYLWQWDDVQYLR